MMTNVMRVVSKYGLLNNCLFCEDCDKRPQMICVTGNNDGKFGAYQLECPQCFRATTLQVFFKLDESGNLVRVNPFAREQAEQEWAEMNPG